MPDRGLPQSHLGFASQGKSMVCKMSKVSLRAGAQPEDQGTRSPSHSVHSVLGTSVKSKKMFAVASLLSYPSC